MFLCAYTLHTLVSMVKAMYASAYMHTYIRAYVYAQIFARTYTYIYTFHALNIYTCIYRYTLQA